MVFNSSHNCNILQIYGNFHFLTRFNIPHPCHNGHLNQTKPFHGIKDENNIIYKMDSYQIQTQFIIQQQQSWYPSNAFLNNPLLQPQSSVETNLHPNNKEFQQIEIPIVTTSHILPLIPIFPTYHIPTDTATPTKPTPNPPYIEMHTTTKTFFNPFLREESTSHKHVEYQTIHEHTSQNKDLEVSSIYPY